MRNKLSQQAAYSVLTERDIFTKETLKNHIMHLHAEQKLSPNDAEKADHNFAFFLLSVEKHAKFFGWDDISEFFTMTDGSISACAYKLTLKFEHLKKSWQTFLNDLQPEDATSYLVGMAKLKDKELDAFFQTQADKDNLFGLLADNPKLIKKLVDNWSQSTALQWFITELSKKPESPYKTNINLVLGLLLEALMASKSDKMNVIFPKFLEKEYVAANIPESSIKKCIQASEQSATNVCEKQQTLIKAIAKVQDRFLNSSHAFMHLVLTIADAESTAELVKNKGINAHLTSRVTSQDTVFSHTYQLILATQDKQKLKNLSNAHLQCLTSRELLKLATHPQSEEIFPLKMLERTLTLRPINFQHTSKEQSDLNREMGTAIQQNRVGSHIGVFYALMSHSDYQEAWLRKQILDPKWNKLGWGLFSMKVPATIAKARKFLEDPKTGTTPLSQDNLQTLLDMFREAQQKSYKYPSLRGEVDFRNSETQKLYDQIVKFGGSEQVEPEVIAGSQLL